MIDCYASLPHYAEHLAPVWVELEARGLAGVAYAPQGRPWGRPLPQRWPSQRWPMLVASYSDYAKVAGRRRVVFLEHGAGQTYPADPRSAGNPCYSGGAKLDNVGLFLTPNEQVADRWRAAYPAVPAVAVGCPRLDSWHARMVGGVLLAEGRTGAERLLDVDGRQDSERIWPGEGRPGSPVGSPGRMVDGDGSLAGRDRSSVPQRGRRLPGRDRVQAPGVREPVAPTERDSSREPRGLAPDGPRQDVPARARVHGSQHLSDAGRTAAMSGLQEGAPLEPYPLVAVTFHWECRLIPETRSALPHYVRALRPLLEAVRAAGGDLLGHAHPRAWGAVERLWRALGVEATRDFGEVLDRADLLVVDNSSAAFEFASLDRPVLTLNAPFYRRDVHHGLRFWDLVPGLQCDEPDELTGSVRAALDDGPLARHLRHQAVSAVYRATDGRAARRAADAIAAWTKEQP